MPTRTNIIDIILKATDKASKEIGAVEGMLGKLGTAAKVAVAASVAIGAGLAKMAIDAAPLEGIKRAFDGLTESIEGGSEKMLKALQKGSKGMIDNRQLMLNFNLASQLVNREFAERLPEALEYLTKVSAATGQSMDYLMNSLILGVGRLSPRIIDNLAVQISATEAYELYAASIGKAADELTRTEQQTAIMNLTMQKLKENTASFPDITNNASTKLSQFGATIENVRDGIGMGLLPVLKVFMDNLNTFVSSVAPGIVRAAQDIGSGLAIILTGQFHEGMFGGRVHEDDYEFLAPFARLREVLVALQAAVDVNLMHGMDGITAVIDAFATIFADPFSFNMQIFADIKFAWDTYLKPVLDGIGQAWNNNIAPALSGLGQGISEFFNNLRGADTRAIQQFRDLSTILIDLGGRAIGGLISGLGDALPHFGSGIQHLVNALSAWSAGDGKRGGEEIEAFITEIGAGILTIPMNVLAALVKNLGGAGDEVVRWAADATLVAGTVALLTFMNGIIATGAAVGIITALKTGLLSLAGFITSKLNPIIAGAALGFAVWESNIAGVQEKVTTILRGWQRLIDPESFEAAEAAAGATLLAQKAMERAAFDATGYGFTPIIGTNVTPEYTQQLRDQIGEQIEEIMGITRQMAQSALSSPGEMVELVLSTAVKLDIDPLDLLDQLMRAVLATGDMAASQKFLSEIVVPVLAKLDEPELTQEFANQYQDIITKAANIRIYTAEPATQANMVVDKINIADQFSEFIKVAALSRVFPSDPASNPTIHAPLPPITDQFRLIVSNAAAAAIFLARAAADVIVSANSVDVTSLVASVSSAISGAIAGLTNFLQNPVASLFNQVQNTSGDLGILRDSGGPARRGHLYRIGTPEYFIPNSDGQIVPLGGAERSMGGGDVHIYFQGSGGPRDEAEAQDSAYLLTTALRTRGIPIGG